MFRFCRLCDFWFVISVDDSTKNGGGQVMSYQARKKFPAQSNEPWNRSGEIQRCRSWVCERPAAVDAAALHSILHDHRRIVEFDDKIDMKLLANHRCDALVHERTGGTFIVPQIDSASGPAVLRTQELFPD